MQRFSIRAESNFLAIPRLQGCSESCPNSLCLFHLHLITCGPLFLVYRIFHKPRILGKYTVAVVPQQLSTMPSQPLHLNAASANSWILLCVSKLLHGETISLFARHHFDLKSFILEASHPPPWQIPAAFEIQCHVLSSEPLQRNWFQPISQLTSPRRSNRAQNDWEVRQKRLRTKAVMSGQNTLLEVQPPLRIVPRFSHPCCRLEYSRRLLLSSNDQVLSSRAIASSSRSCARLPHSSRAFVTGICRTLKTYDGQGLRRSASAAE